MSSWKYKKFPNKRNILVDMAASLQLLRRPVGAGASFSLSATSPARPRDQIMEKLVLPRYFYLSILYFVLCICNCILTCILAENICFLFWYCEWLWLCCFLPQGMLYLCCNTKQQRLSLYSTTKGICAGALVAIPTQPFFQTTMQWSSMTTWYKYRHYGHCSKIKGTHSTHLVA